MENWAFYLKVNLGPYYGMSESQITSCNKSPLRYLAEEVDYV